MGKKNNSELSINANPAGILEIEEFKNRAAKLYKEKNKKRSSKQK